MWWSLTYLAVVDTRIHCIIAMPVALVKRCQLHGHLFVAGPSHQLPLKHVKRFRTKSSLRLFDQLFYVVCRRGNCSPLLVDNDRQWLSVGVRPWQFALLLAITTAFVTVSGLHSPRIRPMRQSPVRRRFLMVQFSTKG